MLVKGTFRPLTTVNRRVSLLRWTSTPHRPPLDFIVVSSPRFRHNWKRDILGAPLPNRPSRQPSFTGADSAENGSSILSYALPTRPNSSQVGEIRPRVRETLSERSRPIASSRLALSLQKNDQRWAVPSSQRAPRSSHLVLHGDWSVFRDAPAQSAIPNKKPFSTVSYISKLC